MQSYICKIPIYLREKTKTRRFFVFLHRTFSDFLFFGFFGFTLPEIIGDNLFFFLCDCRAGKEVFSFCTPFSLIAYGKTRKKQEKRRRRTRRRENASFIFV